MGSSGTLTIQNAKSSVPLYTSNENNDTVNLIANAPFSLGLYVRMDRMADKNRGSMLEQIGWYIHWLQDPSRVAALIIQVQPLGYIQVTEGFDNPDYTLTIVDETAKDVPGIKSLEDFHKAMMDRCVASPLIGTEIQWIVKNYEREYVLYPMNHFLQAFPIEI